MNPTSVSLTKCVCVCVHQVLECVKMSEETTTSSSRIFVKILFQELCAYMGLPRLNQRLKDMYDAQTHTAHTSKGHRKLQLRLAVPDL